MAGGDECKHVSNVNANVNLGSNKKDTKVKEQRKITQEKDKKQEKNNYGSWGPVYKNKEHFTNMHIC